MVTGFRLAKKQNRDLVNSSGLDRKGKCGFDLPPNIFPHPKEIPVPASEKMNRGPKDWLLMNLSKDVSPLVSL